jgi:class 3 adenylate cyclase
VLELPQGVVSFLFMDVEGSTRLWQDAHDVMAQALACTTGVIAVVARSNNGLHIGARGEGDSHFVVVYLASDAVSVRQPPFRANWLRSPGTLPRPIRVQASMHTGAVDLQLGQYFGSPVNRAARLRGIAHG